MHEGVRSDREAMSHSAGLGMNVNVCDHIKVSMSSPNSCIVGKPCRLVYLALCVSLVVQQQ